MKDRVVLSGSILAALVASLCCIGPIVAALLGLGAFSAAAGFEMLRSYLLVLTALLLGAGFYLTYRRREVRCEDGTCKVQRANRTSKILLWIVTALAIGLAALPYWSAALLRTAGSSNAISQTERSTGLNEVKATITVNGMTCDVCAATVERALARTPGIVSVDVAYQSGVAVVVYDPNVVDLDTIRGAIDGTGFKAGQVIAQTGRADAPSR